MAFFGQQKRAQCARAPLPSFDLAAGNLPAARQDGHELSYELESIVYYNSINVKFQFNEQAIKTDL